MQGIQASRGRYLFSLFLVFFLSACTGSSFPSSAPVSHQTYNYAHFGKTPSTVMRAGQFTLTWKPLPGPSSQEAMPTPITLLANLIGPFADLSAAKQAVKLPVGSSSYESVVAWMQPIQTDDWTNQTYFRSFLIPKNIPTGLYVIEQKVVFNGTRMSGAAAARSLLTVV
jgi:hypothetical protein